MKTIYKNLVLGIFLTVFAAAFAAPTFAQDVCADIDANTALYNKFIASYDKGIAQRKIAVEAGKEYIQKYEACATVTKDAQGVETKTLTYAAQITYFKENVPVLEKAIVKEENDVIDKAMYDRFNAAGKSKNVADIMTSGKEVVAKYPDSLDVLIVMAVAGFEEINAKPTVTTYNNDVMDSAKKAIALIEAGKVTSKKYGAFTYQLVSKPNALSVLNYTIASVLLTDPTKKAEAASYFYKATQNESKIKSIPRVYQAIGSNYVDEFLKIDKDRKDKIKAAGDKDTEETLALEAMQRGYAERALDAYAKAYKNAVAAKEKKEYMDTLSTRLKELYAFRFDGKTLDNVDTFVTTASGKTLVDPTTTVTPVKVEVQPETPATTPTKPGTTTKPAATTPTKPVSSTTPATEAGTTAATTTKAKAKKPAPKKKGTR